MASLSSLVVSKHYRLTCIILNTRSFFSRKKKEDSSDRETRILSEGENVHSTNYNLGMLKNKVSLDTRKGYKPPQNVRGIVEKFVVPLVGESEWQGASLKEPKLKYKVVSKLIKEFKHDVPSSALSEMSTVDDVINYFETEVRETSTYEDLTKLDLPENLHIQMDYVRFDPKTDTMFNGRTAFPGSDTHVTSIKYKRKYSDIKTTKEKPGYVNHYYGF